MTRTAMQNRRTRQTPTAAYDERAAVGRMNPRGVAAKFGGFERPLTRARPGGMLGNLPI